MQALSLKLASPRGRWVVLVARLVLAVVFAWAAVPKIMDPLAFAQDIQNYRLVPDNWTGEIAAIVPAVEIALALALLTGLGARGAALSGAAVLIVFTAAIAQAIFRGIDIDCGCFGEAASSKADWSSVARNVALLAGCAVVLLGPERNVSSG